MRDGRGRWRILLVMVLIVPVLVAASIAFVRGGEEAGQKPAVSAGLSETLAPAAGGVPDNQAGARLVDRLESAVRQRSRAAFMALVDQGSRRALTQARLDFANLRRLRVRGFTARYVGPPGGASTAEPVGSAGRRWAGEVELGWGMAGFGAARVRMRVPVTFVRRGPRCRIAWIGRPSDNRVPVWAAGRVRVRRGDRATVVTVGQRQAAPALRQTMSLARRAVGEVHSVISSYNGPLLVFAPASARRFDRLVGVSEGKDGSIAAVTATVDGSVNPRALVGVTVNPPAFARLGARASQVVLTHEATHAATGAATAQRPLWLLEGFADYVALRRVHLPARTVAGQILDHVRATGPPRRLPGDADFGAGSAGPGRAYQASWLACRLISARFGEPKLVALYERTMRIGLRPALAQVLHIDRHRLTRLWQANLMRLADG